MTTDNIDAELQAKFARASLKDWEKVATHELKGKNPFEILSWKGKDGLSFLPYYDATNVESIYSATIIQSAAEESLSVGKWLNLPLVAANTDTTANAVALDHLLRGADGIVFDLRNSAHDLNQLTSNIEWPHCYTGFIVRDHEDILKSLMRHLSSSGMSGIQGGLFWESIPKKDGLEFYLSGSKKFKSLGILLQDEAPCRQIASALIKGVAFIDALSDQKSLYDVFSSIAFSVTADAHLLDTVAKLRALRRLWYQVAQAYGLKNYQTNDVFVHARIEDVPDTNYAPHQNMLNATFASLCAVIGGCDAISIESQISSPLHTRWSRNVSSILKEESFFAQVADPLGGAWAIESITDRIAQESWELFQQKWKDYAKA